MNFTIEQLMHVNNICYFSLLLSFGLVPYHVPATFPSSGDTVLGWYTDGMRLTRKQQLFTVVD